MAPRPASFSVEENYRDYRPDHLVTRDRLLGKPLHCPELVLLYSPHLGVMASSFSTDVYPALETFFLPGGVKKKTVNTQARWLGATRDKVGGCLSPPRSSEAPGRPVEKAFRASLL